MIQVSYTLIHDNLILYLFCFSISFNCVIFSVFFPDKDDFTEILDQKSSINGMESRIVQILGSKNFKNLVWIETEYDYSVICQTKKDCKSNKKNIEGHVCKMFKGGNMELGRFKSKQEWKDGILDNWIGGVLYICKDETKFKQYDENGNKAAEDLVFNFKMKKWEKYES